MQAILALLKSPKVIAGLAAVLFLSFLLYGAYGRGKADCETAYIKRELQGLMLHDKIEDKVIRLSDPDLDRELARWMRD